MIAGIEHIQPSTRVWPRPPRILVVDDEELTIRLLSRVLSAAGYDCIMTTTDQLTGERASKEPLKTLATFRRDSRDPSDVNFGVNLIHETKQGAVRVGDAVVPAA